MRAVFDACEPRSEVLTGELRDEMFAARLKDVIERTADLVYGCSAGTSPSLAEAVLRP
jgi:hypothetical protein